MEMQKHDKVGQGFNVSPEQLAHDLTIVKLSRLAGIESMNEWEIYDRYTELLEGFTAVVEDKIRYDSAFNK